MGEQKEGAANKGETKTNAAGAGKKDEGHITVVLKTEVHCDGCAKKVRRVVKQIKGVKDVNIDIVGKKLTVVGTVDPAKLRQGVEDKTHQKVELLSPLPSQDGGADKKSAEKSEKKDDKLEKKEEDKKTKEITVVLKIDLHCEGCIKKIKSSISKIKGVTSVSIDASKDLVSIKGTMEAKDLAPSLQAKFRRDVAVVPPKKEETAATEAQKPKEGGGGDKNAKEAATTEKKKESVEEKKKELVVSEVNKMEYHGYANMPPPPPPTYGYYGGGDVGYGGVYQPYEGYNYSAAVQSNGYAMDDVRVSVHGPQMFSDENPNACSMM